MKPEKHKIYSQSHSNVRISKNERRRVYDLAILGANGYTGRIAVEYIAKTYFVDWVKVNNLANSRRDTILNTSQKPILSRVALAVRNITCMEKHLKALSESYGDDFPIKWSNFDVLQCDVTNEGSLHNVTKQAKVLLSFVGPYMKMGELVVKACVETDTHYCDISPEYPFVHAIQKYHNEAKKRGLKITPSCGIDCLLNDVGVFTVQKYAIEAYGLPCSDVDVRYKLDVFKFSGGTVRTLFDLIASGDFDSAVSRDPYLLCGEAGRIAKDEQTYLGEFSKYNLEFKIIDKVRKEADFGTVIKSVGYSLSHKIICFSNFYLQFLYGKNFHYSEGMICAAGTKEAYVITYARKIVEILLKFGTIRSVVGKFLPAAGTGPKIDFFSSENPLEYHICGFCNSRKQGIRKIHYTVRAEQGYNYLVTAKLAVESAILLAFQNNDSPKLYGVLTPAVSFGTGIVDRLNKVGIIWKVTDTEVISE